MSDNSLAELKERIYSDGNVPRLLEELGCENIITKSNRGSDDLVTAKIPNYPNQRAIQIYLSPQLNANIVTCGISGNIFSVVGFLLYDAQTFEEVKTNLFQITTYIRNSLDYEHVRGGFNKPELKTDWNYWLRPIQEQRGRVFEITENEIIDEILLNQFVLYPWEGWINEGISWHTQKEFNICFDLNSDRVIIPIHNKDGRLIGAKGRYVGTDKRVTEEMGKKYNYVIPCAKNIELFNLFKAYPYIQESKKVIVVEGAKTTMKLWDWEIRNSVSIEGDKLSPFQVKLLKELGLDIDLIFAWDKGKDKEFVEKQIKQIKNRKVYYLLDNPEGVPSLDRFEDKQSPADKTKRVFEDLLENDIYEFKH